MKARFLKYLQRLEKRAIFFIGLLLSLPIVLVAINSIPERLTLDKTLLLTVIVWSSVFFLKPIRHLISWCLLGLQLVWFTSFLSILSLPHQWGVERLLPGILKTSQFVLDHLAGDFYLGAILWIRNFLAEVPQTHSTIYYWLFVTLIVLAIVTVVTHLLEKRVNWKWFVLIGLYFVVAWFIYVSKLQLYFSVYFVGVTVYKQFGIYEQVIAEAAKRGERTRYYNYNAAVTVGAIIMVVVLLFANISTRLLPMAEMNIKIDQTFPSLGSLRTDFRSYGRSNTFSFLRTMYSPNGKTLGGPILNRDYSVVFRVRADQGSLYLRGRSKNIYTGSEWESDYNAYRNNVFVGDIHTMLPKQEVSTITVYPEHIKTRTVFSPYMYYLSSFERPDIYGNKDRIVYINEDLNAEYESYNVLYVKKEFVSKYDFLNDEDRDNYLQLPKKGLERTTALTEEVVAGIDDPYEKMKKLETYLRENYRYSLYTQEPEGNMDFVEHFLFEEKIGYCTYFATSLAVMGRIADVPTRYIEGYITSDFLDKDNLYEVTANRAHAWVEAYIEGSGWVRFEPTPSYTVSTATGEKEDEEEYQLNSDVDREDQDVVPQDTTPIIPNASDAKGFVIPVDLILNVMLYAGMIALLVFIVYRKRKRMRDDILLGTATEKIHKRIGYMLSMASILNNNFDQAELPKDVLKRMCEEYLMIDLPPVIAEYVDQSLYSQRSFDEDAFNVFDAFFVAYEEKVKLKLNKVGYFFHKYLFNALYHRDYYQ